MNKFPGYVSIFIGTWFLLGIPFVGMLTMMSLGYGSSEVLVLFVGASIILILLMVGLMLIHKGITEKNGVAQSFSGSTSFRVLTGGVIWLALMFILFISRIIHEPWHLAFPVLILAAFLERKANRKLEPILLKYFSAPVSNRTPSVGNKTESARWKFSTVATFVFALVVSAVFAFYPYIITQVAVVTKSTPLCTMLSGIERKLCFFHVDPAKYFVLKDSCSEELMGKNSSRFYDNESNCRYEKALEDFRNLTEVTPIDCATIENPTYISVRKDCEALRKSQLAVIENNVNECQKDPLVSYISPRSNLTQIICIGKFPNTELWKETCEKIRNSTNEDSQLYNARCLTWTELGGEEKLSRPGEANYYQTEKYEYIVPLWFKLWILSETDKAYLKSSGIDPNQKDEHGRTYLVLYVQMLVDQWNSGNSNGWNSPTLVHPSCASCIANQVDNIEKLVEFGIRTDEKDSNSKTAADYAHNVAVPEVRLALLQALKE